MDDDAHVSAAARARDGGAAIGGGPHRPGRRDVDRDDASFAPRREEAGLRRARVGVVGSVGRRLRGIERVRVEDGTRIERAGVTAAERRERDGQYTQWQASTSHRELSIAKQIKAHRTMNDGHERRRMPSHHA